MAQSGDLPHWVAVQKKTFTRWINQQLKPSNRSINVIEDDLSQGVNLIYLLEELSGSSLGKFYENPKSRFEQLLNVSSSINFIKSKNIPLVAIGPEDLVDKNLKLILGLVWMLILRYQITRGERTSDSRSGGAAKLPTASQAKNELLQWVKTKVKPFDVEVLNFTTSFQDGLVLSALTEALKPGTIPDVRDKVKQKPTDKATWFANTKTAISKANDALDIPVLIEAEDLVYNKPDDLSVMTYVSFFRAWEDANANAADNAKDAKDVKDPAKEADTYNFLVLGKGIEDPEVNKPNDFTISIYNKFNKLPFTGNEVEFLLYPPGNSETPESLKNFKNNEDGSYAITYTPTFEGGYEVAVKVFGKLISGRGRIKVRKQDVPKAEVPTVDPKECTVGGDGIRAGTTGKTLHFNIFSNDSKGKPINTGGENFDVKITNGSDGDKPIEGHPQIIDKNDGTYDVFYSVNEPGDYNVGITLNGEPISHGEKFVAKITKSANPKNCFIEDLPEQAKQNDPVKFKIVSKDDSGKQQLFPNEKFDVFILNENTNEFVEPKVTDNNDGSYTVEFVPTFLASLKAHVKLGNSEIANSPQEVLVRKGVPSAQKSSIEGPGLTDGYLNEERSFTVQVRDNDGNPVHVRTGELEVKLDSLDGGASIPVEIAEEGEETVGKYTAKYVVKKPGKYRVSAKISGSDIQNSPKDLEITKLISTEHTKIHGEGAEKAITNKPMEFIVQLYDLKGNKITRGGLGQGAVAVSLDNGPKKPEYVNIRDNDDGSYFVRYLLTENGKYDLNVSVVNEGPEKLKVCPVSIQADDSENFAFVEFQSIKKDGKPTVADSAQLDVEVIDPNQKFLNYKVNDVDPKKGHYSINFTPDVPGLYTVNVRHNGQHIPNSPFTLNVKENPNPLADDAGAAGSSEPQKRAVKYPVKAIRQNGETIPSDKIKNLDVEVKGPKDEVIPSTVQDGGDGTFGVIFVPNENGPHKISVKEDGEHIKGSVFNIHVGPQPEQAKGAPAGGAPKKRVQYPVKLIKADGSDIPPGWDLKDFEAKVSGPPTQDNELPGTQVVAAGTGIGVIFEPEFPGHHKISVNYKGEPLKGSVFNINVPAWDGAPTAPAGGAAAAPKAAAAPASREVKYDAKGKPIYAPIPGVSVAKFPIPKPFVSASKEQLPESALGSFEVSIIAPDTGKEIGVLVEAPGFLTFQPLVAGKYTIHVKYQGVDLDGSPYVVPVGNSQEELYKSSSVKFTITAKVKGTQNLISDKEMSNFNVDLVGPGGAKLQSTITPAVDGTGRYDVAWNPTGAGTYELHVKHQDKEVEGSPFKVNMGGSSGSALPQAQANRSED